MNKVIEYFNTTTKKVIGAMGAIVIMACIVAGAAFASNTVAESKAIGTDNAQKFAMVDAGVDPAKAVVQKCAFENEQGQFVYEVEFSSNGTEYEYLVHSETGAIVKKEMKIVDPAAAEAASKAASQASNQAGSQSSASTSDKASDNGSSSSANSGSKYIGLKKAKSVAMKHACVDSSSVTFTKAKREMDDGIMVYEVEFYSNGMEYEYEINAKSGKIIDHDCERDDDHHYDHD